MLIADAPKPVVVVGAGLAGCEAALALADRGVFVRLFEMKPRTKSPAHRMDGFAELVCSNSLRSNSPQNAVGLLKEELRGLGSRLMQFADATRVPAGDALAVDRVAFSACITDCLRTHPRVEVIEAELRAVPGPDEADTVIVATGPLTSGELLDDLRRVLGADPTQLYFYDAIAPIVSADSVDMSVAFFASRYGKGSGDEYLNCPMTKDEYDAFVRAVLAAEKVVPRAFEEPRYFEGCLPIETLAERGHDTLRFGCMKPVGLVDPRTDRQPYAVVQLRREDIDGTSYNLVGFQTRMCWADQARVLKMIPGLVGASFLRMGQVHRNTYFDSPLFLDDELRVRAAPHVYCAGQITGVEGYVESMACGLYVGLAVFARMRRPGVPIRPPPMTTALGALLGHVLGKRRAEGTKSQGHVPSNVHFGLFEPFDGRTPKRDKKTMIRNRAEADLLAWRSEHAWLWESNASATLDSHDRGISLPLKCVSLGE